MSYIFVNEEIKVSDRLRNDTQREFNKVNSAISKAKSLKLKKLKAETMSTEDIFDTESFTDGELEETTSTGSVGGTFVGPLSSSPIRRSSLFAPEGTPEHEEGNKILKNMEVPIGKIYTKKDIKETFIVSEEDVDESTTVGSVGGSYVQPGIWAKDRANWRGTKKLYPGGKFVHVKEKCKKYPYCNQSPEAIELSDYPKDKLTPVFEGSKKSIHDMYDSEIFNLRDSEYLKLIEIIESVNNLRQFPSVKKLWELFQKKFEGYISKPIISRTNKVIKNKYNELTHNQEIDDEYIKESKNSDSKKEEEFKNVKTEIKSIKSIKQFNTVLKMVINLRVKYNNKFTEVENRELNDLLYSRIKELSGNKKDISENLEIKRVHRKIIE